MPLNQHLPDFPLPQHLATTCLLLRVPLDGGQGQNQADQVEVITVIQVKAADGQTGRRAQLRRWVYGEGRAHQNF